VLCVARDRAGEILFESMIRQARLGLPVGPLRPYRLSVLLQQVLAYLRQVDANYRTLEQFLRVFTSSALPVVDPERVCLLIEDAVKQGLVDRRGQIHQPASSGWDFIQSNRIYSNIEPTPLEVALVNADSGEVVATVASVDGMHVQVAGRTYEIVAGGSVGTRKVRASDVDAASPRYHSRKLPYASDLGAAIAGRLGIGPETLVVIPATNNLVVMTWLGKLLNTALADAMTAEGSPTAPGAFSLTVLEKLPADALLLVTRAIQNVVASNPMGRIKVEQMVDIGPNFRELSTAMQETARRDWLDTAYLVKWVSGLHQMQIIDPDTDLGRDLLAIS